MRKALSSVVLLCMQFVIWTNFAVALDYIHSEPVEAGAEIHAELCSSNYLSDSITEVALDDYPPTNATMDPSSGADSCVDLCLPVAIISESIVPQNLLSELNGNYPFSSITWNQIRTPRPPNS